MRERDARPQSASVTLNISCKEVRSLCATSLLLDLEELLRATVVVAVGRTVLVVALVFETVVFDAIVFEAVVEAPLVIAGVPKPAAAAAAVVAVGVPAPKRPAPVVVA